MGSLPTGGESTRRRSSRRSTAGILAVAAVIAGLLVIGAQPSAAATTSKTFNATCRGADTETIKTLSAFADTIPAPVTVTSEAPAFVEPGQTGVGFSSTLSLSLDAKTVDTIAKISPQLKVSKVKAPLAVSGPTSTTKIDATLPDQTLALTAGQPFVATFPAIKGQLSDIGNSGVIKVATQSLTFTITLTSGPLKDPLNLTCSTGATLLAIPVKVAGSPDIVQPIDVATQPGQPVTVDVLGEHVTNGKTKDGVEQQVDPSTLKIIEGDAQIVDGKVVATGPAAGQSADVTFEVCAGTIKISDADPGISEVQEIRMYFDPNNQALKREIGSRFAFNGQSGDKVVWSRDFNFLLPEPTPPKDETVPPGKRSWWEKYLGDNAFNILVTPHKYPTAAAMQAGLESIPTIGAGNVKVTAGDVVRNSAGNVPEGVTLKGSNQYKPYTVEFTGALANKAVDQITVGTLYSVLAQEVKANLINLAGDLDKDEEGEEGEGGDKTPIPDGLTAKEYADQLFAEAGRLGSQQPIPDFAGWLTTIQLAFKVLGENIGDMIDIPAMTALLGELFQAPAGVETTTQGEDPTPEELQELCSQGIVTLTSEAVVLAEPPATGGGSPPASVEGATALKVAG